MSVEGNMFPPPLNGYCPPDDLDVGISPKRPESIQDIGHYYEQNNNVDFEEPSAINNNDNLMRRMSSFTLKTIPSFRLKPHGQSNQEQENIQKLIEACKSKDLSTVTSLLKATELDVNAKDPDTNKTILHFACEYAWSDIATLLIEKNVKLNLTDKQNKTALHIACEDIDRKALVGILVQHGADITLKTGEDQATAFLLAARYSSPRALLHLLEKGATKHECDREDRNAMHYACLGGNVEVVKFMIDHNFFKLTDRDKNRKTYLHYACEVDHPGTYEIVKYLLMKKPDMLFDTFGSCITSVFLHACEHSTLEIVQYLISKGCSWQNTDDDESTALHYACAGGNLEVVKYILKEQSFNINVKDKWGQTPLYFACKRTNNIDLINHLIDSNAHIEQICKDGYTIMNFITEQLLELKNTKTRFRQQLLSSLNPNYITPSSSHKQQLSPINPASNKLSASRKDSLLIKQRKQWEEYVLQEKKLTYVACKAIRQIRLPQEKGHERVFTDLVACHSLPVLALAIMKYLPYLPSPVTMLNTQLNVALDTKENDTVLFVIFRNYLMQPHRDEMLLAGIDISSSPGEHIAKQYMVVFYILQCINGLQRAMIAHPTERSELKEMMSRLECMLSEILVSNIFYEEPQHLLKMLTHCGDVFPTTQGSEHLNWNTVLLHQFDDTDEVEIWEAIKNPNSIIQYCLKHHIFVFFDKPQIFPWMRSVFFSVPKVSHMDTKNYIAYSFYAWSFGFLHDNAPNERRKEYYGDTYSDLTLARKYYYHLTKYTHSLPANPGIVLFTEFLVKTVFVWLIAMVVIQEYGLVFGADFANYFNANREPSQHDAILQYSNYEVALALYGGSNLLYELGKLFEVKGTTLSAKLRTIMNDSTVWSVVEGIAMLLCIGWFLLRFVSMGEHQFPAARVVLSVAIIPQTFGLLRYLSLYKPLGLLILVMKYILREFFTYVIFYFISIIAFGITLYSLFYQNSDASSMQLQLLTLFGNTLGNFDFDAYHSTSDSVNVLGIVLLIAFLVLTYIVLTYLLIAQMASSYERLKRKAEQEWYYSFALMITKNTFFDERQIFASLPPPFNLLLILLAPFHYLTLYLFGLSLGTTVGNIGCSYMYGTWFRFVHNIYHWYMAWNFHIPSMFEDYKYSFLRKVCFTITYTIAVIALLIIDILFLPLYSIGWEIFYSLHSKVNQTTLVDKYVNENHDFHVKGRDVARANSSPGRQSQGNSSPSHFSKHNNKKSSLYFASTRGKIGYLYLSFVEKLLKEEHILQWKRAISRHAENGEKFGVDESQGGKGITVGNKSSSEVKLLPEASSTGELTNHPNNNNSLHNLFIEIDSSRGKSAYHESTTNLNNIVSYDINDFIPDHPQSTKNSQQQQQNLTPANHGRSSLTPGKNNSAFNFDIPEVRESNAMNTSTMSMAFHTPNSKRRASISSMNIRLIDSLFSEQDILRILRPLKSYVKSSIHAQELISLENNLTQETIQCKEDVLLCMDQLVHQQEGLQQAFRTDCQKLQTSLNEQFVKVAKMNDLDVMKKMLKSIKTDTDTKFQEISHNLINHTEQFLEPLQQSTVGMENKLVALQTNHSHVLQEVHSIRVLVQDEMKRELLKLQGENHNTMITGIGKLEKKLAADFHGRIDELRENIVVHETTSTNELKGMKEEVSILKGQVNSLEEKVVTMEHTLQDIKGILESLVRQNPWSPRKLSVGAAGAGGGGVMGGSSSSGVSVVPNGVIGGIGGSSNGTSSVSGTLSTTSSVRFN